MESVTERDSPLSITSSVAGILTFLVALLAAAYVRVSYLRNADEEYVRVKASLSWYKTESAWLSELAAATTASSSSAAAAAAAARAAAAATNTAFAAANIGDEILAGARKFETEYQMYAFVMDDLARLETRLLELVAETELKAEAGSSGNVGEKAMGSGGEDGRFGLVRRGTALGTSAAKRWWQWLWAGSGRSTVLPTSVAMAWLPVRAKALELVRQRDALTARVLFTQMSMVSSRIRDLEFSARFQEAKTHEALTRLEEIVAEQRADIGRLEDLVYRLMHRKSRLSQSSTGTGTWTSGPVVESPVHATAPSVVEIGLPDRFKRASRHQASRDDTDTTAVGNSGLLVPNRKESVFRSRRMSLPAIARPRSR